MELDLSAARLRSQRWAACYGAVSRVASRLLVSTRATDSLLAVGTPTYEPWHLVAHLRDAAEWGGVAAPPPTLVRWQVPAHAPAHLSVGLDRISSARQSDTVVVIASQSTDAGLLERLADARRHGGTVLAIAGHAVPDDVRDLESVAHETALVAEGDLETAQHLLPLAVAGRWNPLAGQRTPFARSIRPSVRLR